jgi:hypothetical protein
MSETGFNEADAPTHGPSVQIRLWLDDSIFEITGTKRIASMYFRALSMLSLTYQKQGGGEIAPILN